MTISSPYIYISKIALSIWEDSLQMKNAKSIHHNFYAKENIGSKIIYFKTYSRENIFIGKFYKQKLSRED